jgi:hypothetical protein
MNPRTRLLSILKKSFKAYKDSGVPARHGRRISTTWASWTIECSPSLYKKCSEGLRVIPFGVTVDSVPKIPFCGPYEAHAMGARAVNAKLTKKQRQEKARKAIATRWAKRKLAA